MSAHREAFLHRYPEPFTDVVESNDEDGSVSSSPHVPAIDIVSDPSWPQSTEYGGRKDDDHLEDKYNHISAPALVHKRGGVKNPTTIPEEEEVDSAREDAKLNKKQLVNLAKIASYVGLNIEEGKRLRYKYERFMALGERRWIDSVTSDSEDAISSCVEKGLANTTKYFGSPDLLSRAATCNQSLTIIMSMFYSDPTVKYKTKTKIFYHYKSLYTDHYPRRRICRAERRKLYICIGKEHLDYLD